MPTFENRLKREMKNMGIPFRMKQPTLLGTLYEVQVPVGSRNVLVDIEMITKPQLPRHFTMQISGTVSIRPRIDHDVRRLFSVINCRMKRLRWAIMNNGNYVIKSRMLREEEFGRLLKRIAVRFAALNPYVVDVVRGFVPVAKQIAVIKKVRFPN